MHSQSTVSPCPLQLHPPPCHRCSSWILNDSFGLIPLLSPYMRWDRADIMHHTTCITCPFNIPTHSLYACTDPQHCSIILASPHTMTSLLFVTLCYPWPHEPETPSCCPTVPLAMMQPSVQNPQYFHFPM